jgi:hypothetical protein
MRPFKLKLCAAAMLFLFACGDRVELQNQSGEELSGATLQASGKTVWSGSLPAGEQVNVRFSPKGDGVLSVKGQLASGKPVDAPGLGYVTPNGGQKHQIVIKAGGQVQYHPVR